MNALLWKGILFILRKYREPSTWIPFVTWAGVHLHANISDDLKTAVTIVFSSIVAALFVAVQERQGANPCNAPLPPPGAVPVIAPDPGDGGPVVVRRDATVTSGTAGNGPRAVLSGNRPAVRPASVDANVSQPKPHRTGFGDYRDNPP